ncbi:MAG: hypothetical protein NZ949_07115 [Candidatus Kapabacteria bacterium]|nr:hypothetical protein [Candidatus Kapabacteria bacterium]
MMWLSGYLWTRHAGILCFWTGSVVLGTVLLLAWAHVGWGLYRLWQAEWNQLRVQVFCRREALPAVRDLLQRSHAVTLVEFILPEEGWQDLQRTLSIAPMVGGDTILPAVCSAALRGSATLNHVVGLKEQLGRLEGVYEVALPTESLTRLAQWRLRGTVGWYAAGSTVGFLWLLSAIGVLRNYRRRVADYEVLIMFGVMPRRIRLPMVWGLLGCTILGLLGAGSGWMGLWNATRASSFWILPSPAEVLVGWGAQQTGIAVATWWAVLAVMVIVASSGRLLLSHKKKNC